MKKIKLPIYSSRCMIRALVKEDLSDFMIYRNNEKWMEFQGLKGRSLEEYQELLFGAGHKASEKQFAIIKKNTTQLIGDIYLNEEENQVIWIGYSLNPDYSSEGYAYEAILELIFELKCCGYKMIKAGIHPQNHQSENLIRKLKFVFQIFDGEENIFVLEN